MCVCIYVFVCLFACLLACLLVFLFACLLACLLACLFVCLFVCLCVCLFVCLCPGPHRAGQTARLVFVHGVCMFVYHRLLLCSLRHGVGRPPSSATRIAPFYFCWCLFCAVYVDCVSLGSCCLLFVLYVLFVCLWPGPHRADQTACLRATDRALFVYSVSWRLLYLYCLLVFAPGPIGQGRPPASATRIAPFCVLYCCVVIVVDCCLIAVACCLIYI